MKKIELSKSVSKWLKVSVFVVMLLLLFHLLTKAGFFLYMAIGFCIGCVINAILEYLKDFRKARAIAAAEYELTKNQENEVN